MISGEVPRIANVIRRRAIGFKLIELIAKTFLIFMVTGLKAAPVLPRYLLPAMPNGAEHCRAKTSPAKPAMFTIPPPLV
jgi:hypothetical protein